MVNIGNNIIQVLLPKTFKASGKHTIYFPEQMAANMFQHQHKLFDIQF